MRIGQMWEGSEYFDDFSGTLSASNDDNDIDSRVLGKVMLQNGFSCADSSGSSFQERQESL